MMHDPLYYFWIFDPTTGKVFIDHNEGRPKAFEITHDDIRPDIIHPGRVNGYAYKIKDGYRITTEDDRPVEDPYILRAVLSALKREKKEELPYVKHNKIQ